MSGFLRFARRAALLGGAAYAAYTAVSRLRSSGPDEPAEMGADAAPAPVVPGSSTAPETVMPDGAEFNDRMGARTVGES